MTESMIKPDKTASFAPCPNASDRKTASPTDQVDGPPIACADDGVWHVRGFAEARQILRSDHTRQAGFGAHIIAQMPSTMRMPVLYQEGPEHHEQRIQTARFFTPKRVSSDYTAFMDAFADDLIAQLRAAGTMDLSALSMQMAVQVAARVVGLTNSTRRGLDHRLETFFANNGPEPMGSPWNPRALARFLRNQAHTFNFYWTDVRPAIRTRRDRREEDVISYLLDQEYSGIEILTECITYGAAGMVTTREFICAAAWHLLERPQLRARFVVAGETERQAILGEILRLEPVVGHLLRTATADITLLSDGREVTIPAGAPIDLHIYAVNQQEDVAGDEPASLCPARELHGTTQPILSFGDGHHRCPGAYVALQESDIFLRKLLALEELHMVGQPHLAWDDLVKGYEIRDFTVTVEGSTSKGHMI